MNRAEMVEKGAWALETGDFDYYPCDHGYYKQSCADCLAAAVLDAILPPLLAEVDALWVGWCERDDIIGDVRAILGGDQ